MSVCWLVAWSVGLSVCNFIVFSAAAPGSKPTMTINVSYSFFFMYVVFFCQWWCCCLLVGLSNCCCVLFVDDVILFNVGLKVAIAVIVIVVLVAVIVVVGVNVLVVLERDFFVWVYHGLQEQHQSFIQGTGKLKKIYVFFGEV